MRPKDGEGKGYWLGFTGVMRRASGDKEVFDYGEV